MIRRRRIWAVIAGLIFLIIVALIQYKNLIAVWEDYEVLLRARSMFNLEDTIGYTGKKKILFWNSMFSDNWFYMGKSGHFSHCPRYNNCFVTRYRSLVSVENFDMILFHGNEILRYDTPAKRDPRQQYVFVNLESPINRPLSDTFFEDYFNTTMTYRLNSDIPWPYQAVVNIETGKVVGPSQNVVWAQPSYDSLKWKLDLEFDQKNKIAAWLVSNCNTPGKREVYVKELRKHIRVDIIGDCGEHGSPKCPKSRDCFAERIEPEYFFYLSFENTLCKDYVTEKFFKALSHNIIPVVYGGANYTFFAPPHSYIDALDFDSPKELADFLIDLSQNREEYLKYFWWKKLYRVEWYNKSLIMCRLCELVNEPIPAKIYSPLSDWLVKDQCPMHDTLNNVSFATRDSRS